MAVCCLCDCMLWKYNGTHFMTSTSQGLVADTRRLGIYSGFADAAQLRKQCMLHKCDVMTSQCSRSDPLLLEMTLLDLCSPLLQGLAADNRGLGVGGGCADAAQVRRYSSAICGFC